MDRRKTLNTKLCVRSFDVGFGPGTSGAAFEGGGPEGGGIEERWYRGPLAVGRAVRGPELASTTRSGDGWARRRLGGKEGALHAPPPFALDPLPPVQGGQWVGNGSKTVASGVARCGFWQLWSVACPAGHTTASSYSVDAQSRGVESGFRAPEYRRHAEPRFRSVAHSRGVASLQSRRRIAQYPPRRPDHTKAHPNGLSRTHPPAPRSLCSHTQWAHILATSHFGPQTWRPQ